MYDIYRTDNDLFDLDPTYHDLPDIYIQVDRDDMYDIYRTYRDMADLDRTYRDLPDIYIVRS